MYHSDSILRSLLRYYPLYRFVVDDHRQMRFRLPAFFCLSLSPLCVFSVLFSLFASSYIRAIYIYVCETREKPERETAWRVLCLFLVNDAYGKYTEIVQRIERLQRHILIFLSFSQSTQSWGVADRFVRISRAMMQGKHVSVHGMRVFENKAAFLPCRTFNAEGNGKLFIGGKNLQFYRRRAPRATIHPAVELIM